MAMKLQKRLELEGIPLHEVVKYVGRQGDFAACNKYKCGLPAMWNLLKDATGDENYGKNPQFTRINPAPGKTILEEFFERFENWVKKRILMLEEKIRMQDEYIEILELELNHYREKETDLLHDGVEKALTACEV